MSRLHVALAIALLGLSGGVVWGMLDDVAQVGSYGDWRTYARVQRVSNAERGPIGAFLDALTVSPEANKPSEAAEIAAKREAIVLVVGALIWVLLPKPSTRLTT